jgi:hypothetical protein
MNLHYKHANFCPYCKSENIKTNGISHTLIGYFSDNPEDDPNHFSEGCECLSCNQTYVKMWVPVDKNAWFVDNERTIILGEPSCCSSSYKRKCKCGGIISNCTERLDGSITDVHIVDNIGPVQISYWKCNSCQEISPEYYNGRHDISTWENLQKTRNILKKEQMARRSKELPIEFFVEEKIGIGIISPRGIEQGNKGIKIE